MLGAVLLTGIAVAWLERDSADSPPGEGPYEIKVKLGSSTIDGGCLQIDGLGATKEGVDYYLVITPDLEGLEVWDADRQLLPRKERGWYFLGGRPAANEFTICVPQP